MSKEELASIIRDALYEWSSDKRCGPYMSDGADWRDGERYSEGNLEGVTIDGDVDLIAIAEILLVKMKRAEALSELAQLDSDLI